MLLVLLDEPTIALYATPAEARRDLEAIDVANEEYRFCDDRGQIYQGIVTRWVGTYPIDFDLRSAGEPDRANLRRLLNRATGLLPNPFFPNLAALRRSVGLGDDSG